MRSSASTPTGRSSPGTPRRRRTFGWTRDEALGRNMADDDDSAGVPRRAQLRGMRRFLDTGEAPVVNTPARADARCIATGASSRSRSPSPRRCRSARGYFFGAFLRDISDRREQRGAAARRQGVGRGRDAREERVPGQHEPRAADAAQRRARLRAAAAARSRPERRRSARRSRRSPSAASHLLDLINDVLDLSRIEAGRVDIEATPTDLAQLIIDLKYVVADAAPPQGAAADDDASAPDVPRRVVLDGRHLRQVLLNLLGNAVKFTAQGEVRLDDRGDRRRPAVLRGERHRHRHRAEGAREDLRGVHADARRRRRRRHRAGPGHQPVT